MRGVTCREHSFNFQIPIIKKKKKGKSIPQFPIPQFLIPVLGDSRDVMSYFTFCILPFATPAGGLHGAWGASVGNGGLAHNCVGHVAEYSCISVEDTAWRRLGYRTDEVQFQGSVRG